jgi:hypothetical protein
MTDPTSYAAGIEAAARVAREYTRRQGTYDLADPCTKDGIARAIAALAPERGGASGDADQTAAKIVEDAWPEFGGGQQPAEFWEGFSAAVQFTLARLSPAPPAASGWREAAFDALKPFALAAEAYEPDEGDDDLPAFGHTFTIGDLRRAGAALLSAPSSLIAAAPPPPVPAQGADLLAVCTPGAIKLAGKIAIDIMRGPAETCETRQQFLDGAVPIIAAALDGIITPEYGSGEPASQLAEMCRIAFDGDDIIQMRLALRKAHDALLARPVPAQAESGEVDRLRQIVSECADAIGNGARVAPTCSLDFMGHIPNEISLYTTGLRSRIRELEGEVARLRDGREREKDRRIKYAGEATTAEARADRLTRAAETARAALDGATKWIEGLAVHGDYQLSKCIRGDVIAEGAKSAEAAREALAALSAALGGKE